MPHASYEAADVRLRLARLLRNESDVSIKRQAYVIVEYLDIRGGERILDCGCGLGYLLQILSRLYGQSGPQMGISLHGMDPDEKSLDFAREMLRSHQIHFLRGDATSLPYADASFDKVIMSQVLEHIRDDQRALCEVYRVLKAGGTLALGVPHRHYPFWYDPINYVLEHLSLRPIRRGVLAGIWTHHQRLYLPTELRGLLEEVGFIVEDMRELTHYCFPFTHFIVYGLGKTALEHNLLPDFISRSAHRFRSEDNPGHWWNPVNWALWLFNRIDRLNDGAKKWRTYVIITAKAVKP